MKIEKDAVTFEMPDADFVAKFGMQAAADMVLDFHCFHPQLPFLYDTRQQLLGRIQYVLQIEPGNRWFREAKQKLLSCDDLPKV